MAQLKSTVVNGNLRATDSVLAVTGQFKILEAPDANNSNTFSDGDNDQILRSNGSSVYWTTDVKSIQITTDSPLIGGDSSSAQTGAAAYTISFDSQSPNTVLAGPTNTTVAAVPTFRALDENDVTKIMTTSHTAAMYVAGISSSALNEIKYSTGVTITDTAVSAGTYNGLTLTANTTGFSIAGGTTSKSLTVPKTYTLADACAYNVTNHTTAATIQDNDPNLVTGKTVYYGLPTINNAHNYTSSTNIYAPITGGTAGQYLKSNGTTSTPTWAAPPIWQGTCSTIASTAEKAVVCGGFTLVDGVSILVYFSETNSASVDDLTLNVNSTGAKPIKYLYSNKDPDYLPFIDSLRANNTYRFHYYNGGTGNQYWIVSLPDEEMKLLSASESSRVAETSLNGGIGLHRYSLQMMTIDNKWSSIASDKPTASGPNDDDIAKTVATCNFLLNSPIIYQTTNLNATPSGSINANGYTASQINFRQSAASKTGWQSLTVQAPVYLKGQVQSDKKSFKLASTAWWTQTLPTTNDGYIYIFIGLACSVTNVYLHTQHPIYWHDGVQLKLYNGEPSYGAVLPASGREGQLFYQVSDPWYELPAGGVTGQSLIKASTNNYDVMWSSIGGNTPTVNTRYYISGSRLQTTNYDASLFDTNVYVENSKIILETSWNDYAEYRSCEVPTPGACVIENDDGHLTVSNTRLIPGASIVSDTYGMCIGEKDDARVPVAISGRVLAYTFLPQRMYHAGMAVCSAPGGTIDIMTREEIQKYPDAIIGIVSEIPDYEEWGENHIKVNGRIWIKIK